LKICKNYAWTFFLLVWGRIFAVEENSDLSCIVDGNDNEAVTWEFLEFTTIDKMAKLQSISFFSGKLFH